MSKAYSRKTAIFDIDIREFDCLPSVRKTYKDFEERLSIAWNEEQVKQVSIEETYQKPLTV